MIAHRDQIITQSARFKLPTINSVPGAVELRGIIPNSATIGEYMGATHNGFAPHYQPDDMYVGNLLTAIACIDAGITCFIDNSHNSRTAAHSDAAIKALFDSGTRAVHASGSPIFGDWDKQWPQDLDRLQRQYFSSDDQLVTLRIFSRGPLKADWETARRLGLWVSIDGAGRPNSAEILQELKAAGLMDEGHTINHGYGLSDAAWQLIGEAGMPVNVCPRSDSQWSLGPATMGLQDALNHGIRPGISVDNEASYGTDLFTEMRVAFHMQRTNGSHEHTRHCAPYTEGAQAASRSSIPIPTNCMSRKRTAP